MKITIVGLGQIGTSLGLSLGDYRDSFTRVGYDQDAEVARQAKSQGAVDEISKSLPRSVRECDLVILALPMHEIRPALESISGALKSGALVIDTAPIKRAVKTWAEELLPDSANYVGFTPVLNPQYLHDAQFGIEAARKDLFEGGMMAVVSGKNAGEAEIKLATNLIGFLGADPLFVDADEIDGLMTMTYIMPRLLAASLLSATLSKPGWRDGRKIAGRAYARVSGPLTPVDEPDSLASIVMNNRENVLRVIDDVIETLGAFRSDVDQEKEEDLLKMLEDVQKGRNAWWRDRLAASGSEEYLFEGEEDGNILSKLFGFGRPRSTPEDE